MNEFGYTKSYRSKWSNPVFRNLLEAAIWAWMCDMAAWKEISERHNGIIINLNRGQLFTSVRSISDGFSIGEQVTRTFLENLKKSRMINTQPTHKGTIVTICNYDLYQGGCDSDNTHTNDQPTHSQHTANTPINKEKKVRKKEDKNIIGLYDLSVDHIADWLAQKRANGKYLCHDEHWVLEKFISYCKSSGKRYKDYVAAYQNAFDWDKCQPAAKGTDPASKAFTAAQSIIAKRNAAAGIGGSAEPVNPAFATSLRLPENIR